MKYIKTTAQDLAHLQAKAKKWQQKKGGKIADLLDAVAKENQFQNWHHANICQKFGEQFGHTPLTAELFELIEQTHQGEGYVSATGFETQTVSAYLLFNTCQIGRNDAWLFDVFSGEALCVVVNNQDCPIERPITFINQQFDIAWDGTIDRSTPIFAMLSPSESARKKYGSSYIFPEFVANMVMDIGQKAMQQAMGFFYHSTDELNAEKISELVAQGWDKNTLEQASAQQGRYSARHRLLMFPHPKLTQTGA